MNAPKLCLSMTTLVTILTLACAGFLMSCASTPTFNMPEVQKEFQSTLQRNEALVSRTNADFVEKKVLVDSLARNPENQNPTLIGEIKSKLNELETLLPSINRSRANLSELNGQLSAIAYNRKNISRDDEVWERVRQTISEFDQETKSLALNLAQYARSTNTLSDLIEKNKLFVTLDLGEFQKRLQKSIRESNSSIQTMNEELAKLEKVLNLSSQETPLEDAQKQFSDAGLAAEAFGREAQKLPELSARVRETTLGNAKISSLDPNWSQVQKSIRELDEIEQKLDGLKRDYQARLAELQATLKALRK